MSASILDIGSGRRRTRWLLTQPAFVRGFSRALLILVRIVLAVLIVVVVMRQDNGFCGDAVPYEPPFTCFEPEDAAGRASLRFPALRLQVRILGRASAPFAW
jgi:hypothetical protein